MPVQTRSQSIRKVQVNNNKKLKLLLIPFHMETRSKTKSLRFNINGNENPFIFYIKKLLNDFDNIPKSNKLEKMKLIFGMMYNINNYLPELLCNNILRWKKFAFTTYNKAYEYIYIENYEGIADINYVNSFIKYNNEVRRNLLKLFNKLNIYPKYRILNGNDDTGMILIEASL